MESKIIISIVLFCILFSSLSSPIIASSRDDIKQAFDSLSCTRTSNADMTIANNIISLSTTSRAAGAVEHLKIGGREIVDIEDLGRQIQYATTLNGYGECLNPTEAGTRADRAGPTSSKFIEGCRLSSTKLYTKNQPAYWLAPGRAPTICGSATSAINTTILSDNYITKIIDVGFREMNNVVRFLAKLTINEPWDSNYGEGPVYVLKSRFTFLYKFNIDNFSLTPLEYTERTAFEINPPDIPVVSDGVDFIAIYNPKPVEQGFKYMVSNFPNVDTVVSAKYFTTPEKNLNSNDIYWESYLIATDNNSYRRDIYKLLSTVDSHNLKPVGKLEKADTSTGNIKGWVFDPNNMTKELDIAVYKDGSQKVGVFKANIARPDVNSTAGIEGNHGFDFNLSSLTNLTGTNQLSLYAIDDKNQLNKLLNPDPITYTSTLLSGDLNGDGKVNIFDFNLLVRNFGNPYTIFDFNALVANFGK